jgi:hypothetical protein
LSVRVRASMEDAERSRSSGDTKFPRFRRRPPRRSDTTLRTAVLFGGLMNCRMDMQTDGNEANSEPETSKTA